MVTGVAGDAMREAGIDTGDLVIVDRAITPAHGHVVIAVVDDTFACRRLFRRGEEMSLHVLAYNLMRVINILGVARTMKAMNLVGA